LDDGIHFRVHAADFFFEVLNFLSLFGEFVRFVVMSVLEILDLVFELSLQVTDILSLKMLLVFELGVDIFESSLEAVFDFGDHLLNKGFFISTFFLQGRVSKVVQIERLLLIATFESLEKEHEILDI
jgi:hypothetical protein